MKGINKTLSNLGKEMAKVSKNNQFKQMLELVTIAGYTVDDGIMFYGIMKILESGMADKFISAFKSKDK
jgi:hypothetical protein